MKKLFMFLVTAGLATFGTSCTSDDSSGNTGTGNEQREKQLVLSADKDKAVVGETVTFKTTVEGKVQSDVDIYVDGTKVANPFKTTKRGDLKVVAKKAGYMNSATFDLKVRDQGEPENTKLVLSASATKVNEGEMVTFTVMNGGNAVTDAEITLNGAKITNPWKATTAGSYKFIAKKAKYDDSNEVTVVVGKNVVIPTSNVLVLGDEFIELKGGAFFYYTKGGKIYREVLGDGRTVSLFRIGVYVKDITGNISASDNDNAGHNIIYVVQDPKSTATIFPWDKGAEILAGGFYGKVKGVEFDADDETGYSAVVMSAPGEKDGRGTAQFKAEGKDVNSKKTLKCDYSGPYQAYFEVKLPESRNEKVNFRTLSNSVRVNKIK